MSHLHVAHCIVTTLVGWGVCLGATLAAADEATTASIELPSEPALSGQQIYERVVANRFHSFAQETTLISADRAGRSQESRFHMKWQDFRDQTKGPNRNVVSKTLVRYSHPFDLRHAGYLILSNRDRANDQFVYYPSRRRVARVSLRSEAVYGTDFSFEDVVPREAEDFHSERLPDALLQGVEVYVVDLTPREHVDSEYSRIRVYVDKQRSVVVHARYWDAAFVEIKQLLAPSEQIREYEGIYVPMHVTMRNLLLDTQTTLIITTLEPNPRFEIDIWDLSRLESH